jgi:hypothetical protein
MAMQKRILRAFCLSPQCSQPKRSYRVEWDHGQWFVTHPSTGAWFSVEDAEGKYATDGFAFEVINEGNPYMGGKRRHSGTSSRMPHKMTAATVRYQAEVKDRARRVRQIICVELPDGTYWGADMYGHTLYAKDGNICSAKLVAKANKWLKTHPKDALRAKVDELNELLKD